VTKAVVEMIFKILLKIMWYVTVYVGLLNMFLVHVSLTSTTTTTTTTMAQQPEFVPWPPHHEVSRLCGRISWMSFLTSIFCN
jgi:hypothetical protein